MTHTAHGTAAAGTAAGATAPSLLLMIDTAPDNGSEDRRHQTGYDPRCKIHFHYPLYFCTATGLPHTAFSSYLFGLSSI